MPLSKTAGNGVKKNIPWGCHGMRHIPGGWGGIRTPGGVAPTTVFKTVAIDRSATHPKLFFCAGLSNRRFCSLTAPGGAAHHSFALETFFLRRSFKPTVLFADRTWRCCSPLVRARLRDACLADSYARPSQSTAALTHPKLFYAPVWASIFFVFWVSRVSLYMFFL